MKKERKTEMLEIRPVNGVQSHSHAPIHSSIYVGTCKTLSDESLYANTSASLLSYPFTNNSFATPMLIVLVIFFPVFKQN